GRPDQRQGLAAADAQADVVEDFDDAVFVEQVVDFQLLHAHAFSSCRQRSTCRLIGSSSRYSVASSAASTATTQARVPEVSSWARVTASAAPTPSELLSSSAITTTFQDVPSAVIQ